MPVDVIVIARNDLSRDSRVQKEVVSLTAQGHSVRAVGIATDECNPGVEEHAWGVVELVETRRHPPTGGGPRDATEAARRAATAYAGRLGDLRHWLGRVRENVILGRAVAEHSPRFVIACDLDTLLAGWLAKRRTRACVVYDAHELYVQMHPEKTALFGWLYGALERMLIRRVDHVMTVNNAIAAELARRYGIAPPLVVMNGPIECTDEPCPVHRPLRLLFQGSFGYDRGLDQLVMAMREGGSQAVLTLQGFGGVECELRELVERAGLGDRVRFLPPCAPEESVSAARDHDIGVICYSPDQLDMSENLRLSSPTKLFEYLGAGLGILSPDLPAVRAIAGEAAGFYVARPDAPHLARAIAELAADPEQVRRMKAAACASCEALRWDVQFAPVLEWVAECLGRTDR